MSQLGATGGGATPPGAATAAMQRQVDLLQAQVVQLRRLQSSGRWWLAISTLLVVALIVAFTLGTYQRIKENFNHDAVQLAVNSNGTDVLPIATQMLMQTGRDAMPAYQAAMVQGLRERGPAIADAAYKRLQQVPEDDGKMMQDKLQATFDAAFSDLQPQMKQAFPNLSTDKQTAMLADFKSKQIEAANKTIAAHATQLYTNDLNQMQEVLNKFQLPDASAPGTTDNRDLEREFLHTMVMLLDQQVDAAYAGGSGSTTQPASAAGPSSPQASAR